MNEALPTPNATNSAVKDAPPIGNFSGFFRYFRSDVISGFLVFLIAMPLCLAIATASGFPPIAGILTAIVGGIIPALISNSEMTIKGPAAGLIVIVAGCIKDFGGPDAFNGSPEALTAYRLALGIGVVSGLVQIVFSLIRSGVLGDFFPVSAVHGMLAAIGVIIIITQFPVAMGAPKPQGETALEKAMELPHALSQINPAVALIGLISLGILFGAPLLKSKIFKVIPVQIIVLLVAIPLAIFLNLGQDHTYQLAGKEYGVGPKYLVPEENLLTSFVFPDFSGLLTLKGWKWVLMFALIGTLESLLSAKAVDSLDPYRRKTNLDRDLLGVGIANTLVASIGGLPMISEIVRSRANIDNGAKTRFGNLFHGLFLLLFVGLAAKLIHMIPFAALGAMLVYTGFRLASPKEWYSAFQVGPEQLVIFATTVVAVLATDLLVGIGIGIALKFLIHLWNFPPFMSLFRPKVYSDQVDEKTTRVKVYHAAVFSNWLAIKSQISKVGPNRDVVLDLSETHLVDHTVMEQLHEMEEDFHNRGHKLTVIGHERHKKLSHHHSAARKKVDRPKEESSGDR